MKPARAAPAPLPVRPPSAIHLVVPGFYHLELSARAPGCTTQILLSPERQLGQRLAGLTFQWVAGAEGSATWSPLRTAPACSRPAPFLVTLMRSAASARRRADRVRWPKVSRPTSRIDRCRHLSDTHGEWLHRSHWLAEQFTPFASAEDGSGHCTLPAGARDPASQFMPVSASRRGPCRIQPRRKAAGQTRCESR